MTSSYISPLKGTWKFSLILIWYRMPLRYGCNYENSQTVNFQALIFRFHLNFIAFKAVRQPQTTLKTLVLNLFIGHKMIISERLLTSTEYSNIALCVRILLKKISLWYIFSIGNIWMKLILRVTFLFEFKWLKIMQEWCLIWEMVEI